MKDPQRLLDASANELELRLLRAGASEQPPAAALQRLAETLGVDNHSVPVASQLPAAAAKKLSLFSIGVVAVGMTVAGVVWVATRPTELPAASAPQAAPGTALEGVQQIVAGPSTSAPTLAQEISRIDAIRRDIATDRGKSAISALQDYQRDFPSGVLQQEAELLNIEAHRQAGDRRRARALATRFLANNPDSPHSARVRELLEALGPDAR
jgi:TolA-binding protein